MDINQPGKCFNLLNVNKLTDIFQSRNIEVIYCETKEEAVSTITGLIPKSDLVSCGGSATLRELEMREVLKKAGYHFLDPDDAQGGAAKEESARQALLADTYLMSANAIAMSGEIVNLDGIGNRVAALSFGPKKVMIIAGMNKITPDLPSAIQRAKTIAAPMTLLLFKQDYASFDELAASAEKAWSQLCITTMSVIKGRITLLIVGETLGF